jgi:hypothetical protein
MRRRSREINVFNLSMLDVIAGAMAAFLILVVILLPYYDKTTIDHQAEIQSLTQALAAAETAQREAQTQAAQAQQEAARQQARAEGLARQLARTFLVLYVRWDTHDDIDLHVIDPSGAEFWWNEHKRIPGRPGELSEDAILGPANEVWEIRDAPPGDYRIEVNLFAIRDTRKPVVVKGRVFHRDGSALFKEIRLHRLKQRERIATIQVDDSGRVTVR